MNDPGKFVQMLKDMDLDRIPRPNIAKVKAGFERNDSNFNTREFNSRELVQFFQLYSKRLSSFLTIFGHKIVLFFRQLLTTKRDLISIKEGQNLRFEIFKHFQKIHEY